ncbi:MAG: adenine phosphoribosyltransferase [Erysipelotrichaceae bacterium]|nr:adenine phosphoribosyltransferase [Erysipelotrichaceae bacterium]
MDLKKYIANIEDFPKKGIIFRDVTPIMQHKEAFSRVTDLISEYAKSKNADYIVGPEARGFMFGCPVATKLNLGFIPVRKPGKLPREVISEEYSLEYGTNTLTMHKDALKKGDKVVIVDDLLATGGTVLATAHLCQRLGAEVVGCAFVIDLIDLKGREALKDYDIFTIMEFEGE